MILRKGKKENDREGAEGGEGGTRRGSSSEEDLK